MSKVEIDEAKILNAMAMALNSTVSEIEKEISEITPRDKNRPPKDPERKVSWNLKRSIRSEMINDFNYVIWVMQWDEESYAAMQEFWWVVEIPRRRKWVVIWTYFVYIPPRSYLRKTIEEKSEKFEKYFQKVINSLIWK